ncbi:MAG: MATE family efflux transporter [Ruminococcaceae bacterium]|nr:MATE family efflux transporter [Oscillospiraceae bacterium]
MSQINSAQISESKPQENKMGIMPINKLLLSMSLPMMISMLVQALYNIVDSIFVAKLNENALTAVSLAFPVQNLMIAAAAGTGVGVNALLSRSLGEHNIERANKTATNSMLLFFLTYILFAIFGLVASKLFFSAQTEIDQIIAYGQKYLFIICVFSFGIFGEIVFERLLQSTGKTVYTMITQGIGAIVNIILDPIMIFGLFGFPRMEVAGAALATVIGQIVAMLLGLYFNIKKNKEISLNIKGFRPNGNIIKRIYSVGIPSIIMQSIASVMTFDLNQILMAFTSTATAVFGVYFKLQSFIFMPIFGLNNGMVPIVAYNLGARKKERMTKTIFLSITYAVSLMLIGMLIMQLFPTHLLRLFDASNDMLSIGTTALRVISLSFLFAGFCIISTSVFQAIGNGLWSMMISIIRQLVVLLPVAYLLSKTGNLNLVWFAFPIAECFSLVLCIIMLRRTLRTILTD